MNELIEKYIGNRKVVKYSKFQDYDDTKDKKALKLIKKRMKRQKNEDINESSELWFGSWSRGLLIYVKENEVLWSYNHEFPPGYVMTPEDRQRARARGYTILDMK